MADFDTFLTQLRARLEQGRQVYGDRSFSADPSELLAELEQEALDLAGWGFVLWTRLQAAKRAAARLERPSRLVGADRDRALQVIGGRCE